MKSRVACSAKNSMSASKHRPPHGNPVEFPIFDPDRFSILTAATPRRWSNPSRAATAPLQAD
jgi:hypothetical protein